MDVLRAKSYLFGFLAAIIVFAAAAFVFNQINVTRSQEKANKEKEALGQLSPYALQKSDRYRGNPDAPITVIEYSDTECPFCKKFQAVKKKIFDDYGGDILWIYRHFPITYLHSKAFAEAEALECAGVVGGEDAFWEYLDKIYYITPSNNLLDPLVLIQIADEMGVPAEAFAQCRAGGLTAEKVRNDIRNGILTGITSTPSTVLIGPDKKPSLFPGSSVRIYYGIQSILSGSGTTTPDNSEKICGTSGTCVKN